MQIIYKKTSELKKYKNNPRKNELAVEKVAESIKEFGFRNPILIDKDNEIVCGHTRYDAAKKLGIKEVPCIIADDLTESYRRNGIKDCFCEDCGTEFSVRKDTHPKVCRHCTSVRGGRALKGKRAETRECRECGKEIYKGSKNTFCSVKCRNDNLKLKEYKECGISFEVTKDSISSKTKATGNYCSESVMKNICVGQTGQQEEVASGKKKKKFLRLCRLCYMRNY